MLVIPDWQCSLCPVHTNQLAIACRKPIHLSLYHYLFNLFQPLISPSVYRSIMIYQSMDNVWLRSRMLMLRNLHICFFIYQSTRLYSSSFYPPTYVILPIYPFIYPLHLYANLWIFVIQTHKSFYFLPICISFYLFICPSTESISLSVCLSTCLFTQ